MQFVTNQLASIPVTFTACSVPKFPPLNQVTSPTVSTAAAAYYLNRKPQTLRAWACLENGAIRPVRVHGRLAWSVNSIRNLLNGGGE